MQSAWNALISSDALPPLSFQPFPFTFSLFFLYLALLSTIANCIMRTININRPSHSSLSFIFGVRLCGDRG